MTILGRGDLSPPRRPSRRRGRGVVALLAVAALAAGGWFGWHSWHGSGTGRHAAVKVCVTPTAAPSPTSPAAVAVSVLNATDRAGLAHQVAATLRGRGFHVGHVGNTSDRVSAPAAVRYARGQEAAARTLAEQVPGAVLVPVADGGVTLELGNGFARLATSAEAATARAHDLQAASPRPPVCTGS